MVDMWVVSDWHLFHDRIIEYGERPFKNVPEMHDALLTYHNELVTPNAHVYMLGDATMLRGSSGSQAAKRFIELVRKFNGHKRLILGNHDHFPLKVYQEAGFEKVVGTGRWLDNLLFSHYPVHPSSIGSATANVHGHTHQRPDLPLARVKGYKEDDPERVVPYINVCVERTNYRPLSLEEVKARIAEAITSANIQVG